MPSWWQRLRRATRRDAPSWPELSEPAPAAEPLPVEEPVHPALADLPLHQVCALWRKSRAALTAAATPEEQVAVVGARAALLGELERRQPAAMAAWVAGGGQEPEGPAAYLVGAPWSPLEQRRERG